MNAIKDLLVAAFSILPVEATASLFEQARIRRLRRRLAHCGERVAISRDFYVEDPSRLTIEDDASFGPGVSVMGVGGCWIGVNAMIATQVLILTTTHDRTAPVMRQTGVHREVLIESNTWIGAGAILLPGAIVRTGSVVGAGAVVTGEVAAGQVVVGIPARSMFARTAARP
jgi:maltose O-acetyltransferase